MRRYICPICNYYGFFKNIRPASGERRDAQCARCGSLERHRLQYLVFKKITTNLDTQEMSMLHFAPESFFKDIFRNTFGVYITADIEFDNVDRREDLTRLSFGDNTFDFVYASHVLEHIKKDFLALSEIKRVLKPGGCAIIPVPLIGQKTIEYKKANPHEYYHVRCPGSDYYDRYKKYFSKIRLFCSSDFDEKYQLYYYENRTKWPAAVSHRPFVAGERHLCIVPVCYK